MKFLNLRNNSVRDIDKYADEALAINRMVEHNLSTSMHLSRSSSTIFYAELQQQQQQQQQLESEQNKEEGDKKSIVNVLDNALTPTGSPNDENFFNNKLKDSTNTQKIFNIAQADEGEYGFDDLDVHHLHNVSYENHFYDFYTGKKSAPIEMRQSSQQQALVGLYDDEEENNNLSSTLKESNFMRTMVSNELSASSSSGGNQEEEVTNSSNSNSKNNKKNKRKNQTKNRITTKKV